MPRSLVCSLAWECLCAELLGFGWWAWAIVKWEMDGKGELFHFHSLFLACFRSTIHISCSAISKINSKAFLFSFFFLSPSPLLLPFNLCNKERTRVVIVYKQIQLKMPRQHKKYAEEKKKKKKVEEERSRKNLLWNQLARSYTWRLWRLRCNAVIWLLWWFDEIHFKLIFFDAQIVNVSRMTKLIQSGCREWEADGQSDDWNIVLWQANFHCGRSLNGEILFHRRQCLFTLSLLFWTGQKMSSWKMWCISEIAVWRMNREFLLSLGRIFQGLSWVAAFWMGSVLMMTELICWGKGWTHRTERDGKRCKAIRCWSQSESSGRIQT